MAVGTYQAVRLTSGAVVILSPTGALTTYKQPAKGETR